MTEPNSPYSVVGQSFRSAAGLLPGVPVQSTASQPTCCIFEPMQIQAKTKG